METVTADTLLLRDARTPFADRRFEGEDALVGEEGSRLLAGGLNICEGSTDSLVLPWRVCARGVVFASMVTRLVVRRGRTDSRVNSSPLSSALDMVCRRLITVSSSSESSSTILRRGARCRDGRDGDSADIVKSRLEICRRDPDSS